LPTCLHTDSSNGVINANDDVDLNLSQNELKNELFTFSTLLSYDIIVEGFWIKNKKCEKVVLELTTWKIQICFQNPHHIVISIGTFEI